MELGHLEKWTQLCQHQILQAHHIVIRTQKLTYRVSTVLDYFGCKRNYQIRQIRTKFEF